MHISLLQAPFIHENLVPDLCHVVCDSSNPEAQKHIAGTLRNLAVSQYVRVSMDIQRITSLDQVFDGISLNLLSLKQMKKLQMKKWGNVSEMTFLSAQDKGD